LGILLAIPDARIYDALKFVRLFGESKALFAAQTIQQDRLSVTMSHVRQLNRLSSVDFTKERNEVFDALLEGKLPVVKDVESRVDGILGVTRRTITMADPAAYAQEPMTDDAGICEAGESEDFEKETESPAPIKSNPSTESRPSVLRSKPVAVLPQIASLRSLDQILGYARTAACDQTKQWLELSDKIHQWRADADIETLKDVDPGIGLDTINALKDTCNGVKDVLTQLTELYTVVAAMRQDATKTTKKITKPANANPVKLAQTEAAA
jgi:hypothetical protein